MESFDNFALYFKLKNKIEQETNSIVDGYTLAQFLYGTYIFVYGYDFLYQQANRLPATQMMEMSKFLSCCKEYEKNEHELFFDMCKSLHCQYESLSKYVPMGHRMLESFICNWNHEKNKVLSFIQQASILITFEMYSVDTSADFKYLKSYYDLCRKKLNTTAFKKQSNKILDDIKRTVLAYCKQLGIDGNIKLSDEVKDNGTFYLSWKYVTFTSKAIYLYHPHNSKSSYPFEYKTNDSNSAFNSIKSYFINRLPPIYVEAKDRQIIKILDVQNISNCIKKLTAKAVSDKQYKRTGNDRALISKKKDLFSKEISDRYKSKYLDWLCSHQSDCYPIYYSIEVRTNSDLISTNEDAFIFIIATGMKQITIIYENTNDSRSTLIFKAEKSKLNDAIKEIHELFASDIVNKREQIANGKLNHPLCTPNNFWRVLHTDFENWKERLITL
nr:MAG TPA: hypothetical protein [Caudoviricetes sp.]